LGDGVLKRAEDNGPEKWRQSVRNTLKKPLRDLPRGRFHVDS